mmetsp:Transcript_46278/g.78765  ORF Transcript_46278/g.78765 Transcript_46278/m.78765 type:complete len:202 (-) Transcript_46278:175-780(-)
MTSHHRRRYSRHPSAVKGNPASFNAAHTCDQSPESSGSTLRAERNLEDVTAGVGGGGGAASPATPCSRELCPPLPSPSPLPPPWPLPPPPARQWAASSGENGMLVMTAYFTLAIRKTLSTWVARSCCANHARMEVRSLARIALPSPKVSSTVTTPLVASESGRRSTKRPFQTRSAWACFPRAKNDSGVTLAGAVMKYSATQ